MSEKCLAKKTGELATTPKAKHIYSIRITLLHILILFFVDISESIITIGTSPH